MGSKLGWKDGSSLKGVGHLTDEEFSDMIRQKQRQKEVDPYTLLESGMDIPEIEVAQLTYIARDLVR